MRCQRVRYYLSAFYKGELSEGKRKAVEAHLKSCTECGREEAFIQEMNVAGSHLMEQKTSDDFNGKLLNRIASERFHETRTKSYFPPKRVPVFSWSRAIPVAATACLVLAFVLTGGLKDILNRSDAPSVVQTGTSNSSLDDRYMTVQPQGEHALAVHKRTALGGGQWAFHKELARVNRIKGFVNSLASQTNFDPYCERNNDNLIIPVGPRLFLEMIINGQQMTRPLTSGEPAKIMEAEQTY